MKKSIISVVLILAFAVVMLAGCQTPGATVTPGTSQGTESAVAQELVAYYNSLVGKYDYTKDNKVALDAAYQAGIKNIEENEATAQDALAAAKNALDQIAKVGEKTFTLNDYVSASPNNWNVHAWVTNGDQYIHSYAEMGLVDVAMKSEGEYEWVYEMATNIEDITASATDAEKAKWNITEGQTSGRMFKISLNPNAKWANGTPINADTYVYSTQQLLSSEMKNTRADLYWSGENAIFNGEQWFRQDEIGAKSFAKLGKLNMTTTEAIAAGYDLYVDIWGFWSIKTEDGSMYSGITDETLIRDPSVPEGEAGDWISSKEIYDAYFAPGCAYESYAADYVYYVEGTIEKIDWEDVGFYKVDDYTVVYVTANVQSMFNFLISAGSNWIVYEDLYEQYKETNETTGLTITKYGTSLDSYMSYGPYKLASFERDKQFTFVKNENWYGWTDGKHEGQYQTTNIKVDVLTEQETILQMFVKGELDGAALTSSDLETYGASDYLLKTPETYTMKFSFNTNLDVLKKLEQERNDGTTIQILANANFRKAMSWAFDRETWCKEVTAGEIPQLSLLSNLYFYDVENNPNSVYRNSKQAMQGIVDYYGIKYGEGERYATLEEAYAAISGYDVEKAKELFTTAYNEAIADGTYVDGTPIVIQVGAAKGAETAELTKQEKKFNDFLKAATVGTPLEGKVSVKYFYNLNDRYADCSDGIRECCYGGLGGAAFYPYRCFNSYIDETQAVGGKITEGNFDPYAVSFEITYDFNGDGTAETLTKNMFDWNASITEGGEYFAADHDLKLTVLSAIERNILEAGHCFPITVTASVAMYSKQIKYATLNYNMMYGYGGTRLMTYNFSDYEWEQYVAEQDGHLSYE